MKNPESATTEKLLYSVVCFPYRRYIVCEYCNNHWDLRTWPADHVNQCAARDLLEPEEREMLYCGNCGTKGNGRDRPNPLKTLESTLGALHLTHCSDCIAQSKRANSHATG